MPPGPANGEPGWIRAVGSGVFPARADDHILSVAYISLDALRAAPVGPTPVWLIRLILLLPRFFAPIEVDPDCLVRGKATGQRLPKLGLVSRHDYQRSNHPARLAT
jgi:hypothetical protein